MSKGFESINSLDIYETDGSEEKGLSSDRPKVIVKEHWNRREFVVIEVNGKELTVLADELKRAIDNAQNAHKY
jgi:hypothetical protein